MMPLSCVNLVGLFLSLAWDKNLVLKTKKVAKQFDYNLPYPRFY